MPKLKLNGTAAADFTASRFLAGVRDTNGDIALAGAGVAITGIIQDGVDVGQTLGVIALGVSFCVFGATVAAGEQVEVDAAGKFIPLAAGIAVGICEVGGAADAIGCVLLK